MISKIFIASLCAVATSAAFIPPFPGGPGGSFGGNRFAPKLTGCDVSKATFDLPSGVAIPAGQTPTFVALGRGVQNYTCTNGTFAKNMAVATLFDASCAVNSPLVKLTDLPSLAMKGPDPTNLPTTVQSCIGKAKLGDHFFQKLSPTAASANPVFDFSSSGHSYAAFSKASSAASPQGASNIAWLQLANVEGSMATTGLRINTVGGVAPATVRHHLVYRRNKSDADATVLD
ncbi:hypothetical protein EMMF5_001736 [Cystobasidiomycetes sp. EMM_F5]